MPGEDAGRGAIDGAAGAGAAGLGAGAIGLAAAIGFAAALALRAGALRAAGFRAAAFLAVLRAEVLRAAALFAGLRTAFFAAVFLRALVFFAPVRRALALFAFVFLPVVRFFPLVLVAMACAPILLRCRTRLPKLTRPCTNHALTGPGLPSHRPSQRLFSHYTMIVSESGNLQHRLSEILHRDRSLALTVSSIPPLDGEGGEDERSEIRAGWGGSPPSRRHLRRRRTSPRGGGTGVCCCGSIRHTCSLPRCVPASGFCSSPLGHEGGGAPKGANLMVSAICFQIAAGASRRANSGVFGRHRAPLSIGLTALAGGPASARPSRQPAPGGDS